MKKRLLLALPCVLASFLLAACGGGGGEEDRVEATIRAAFLDEDPSSCTELMTARFREQTALEEDDAAALRECREEIGDPEEQDTDSVSVGEVSVDGSTATAQVAFGGGSFDGQTVEISLVKEEGGWKLDEADRFVKFDRASFAAALRKDLREGDDDDDSTPGQRRCVAALLSHASPEKVETVFFRTSTAAAFQLVRDCPSRTPRGSDEQRIEKAIRALAMSQDPAACLEFATQHYAEETSGESGVAAVQVCGAGVKDPRETPESIEISDVAVDGSEATANAAPFGNGLEGQVFVLGLIEERGRWLLNSRLGLARIDRAAYAEGLAQAFVAEGVDVTRAVTACIDRWMGERSREEVEDLLLLRGRSPALLADLGERCTSGTREDRTPAS